MDSLRLDRGFGLEYSATFFSFCKNRRRQGKARQGKARDGKVVYVTYTIFSKIPMMTDDDDDEKGRGRGE